MRSLVVQKNDSCWCLHVVRSLIMTKHVMGESMISHSAFPHDIS